MLSVSIRNVHERRIDAPPELVGELIDSLGTERDRLWPKRWPPLRLERGLVVGSPGRHGPIGYDVSSYVPGRVAAFRLNRPHGLTGEHRFEVEAVEGGSLLRHALEGEARGPLLLAWPLFFRPLHDALVEDALDEAESEATGKAHRPAAFSRRVRLLRAIGRRRAR